MVYFLMFLGGVALGAMGVYFLKSGASKKELTDWTTRLEAAIEKDALGAKTAVAGVVAEIKKKL
jgi:hypothetical protein